ncbi:uncharacterized protein AMSG_01402 [Thecamonas trahens ATCC 50062]|uniref:Hint domain-containing protein n=1 Tax=Thecamonas trahens ATCC 50062 TaxID=461836 RepID=A0A0L0DNV3_THETB|nr:hypothetical protein AMSG_01402 [Thecamonas trahens ATCC 50062]KNC53691.1 hypothetical protein AMSG_01402 [Thecamonas trahens ATCC 50062]|eukprot:XP_013762005.1 hypothetical protein AMSG_01402 [Thecamonas trahens ATCC 50062]
MGLANIAVAALVFAAVVGMAVGQTVETKTVNFTTGTVTPLTPFFSNPSWAGNEFVSVTIQVPDGFTVSEGVRFTKCANIPQTAVFSTLDTCGMGGGITAAQAVDQLANSEMEFGTVATGYDEYRVTITMYVGAPSPVPFESESFAYPPPPPSPPPPPVSPPPPQPPPPSSGENGEVVYKAWASDDCTGVIIREATSGGFNAEGCHSGGLVEKNATSTFVKCTEDYNEGKPAIRVRVPTEIYSCDFPCSAGIGVNTSTCRLTKFAKDTCYKRADLDFSFRLEQCGYNDCFPGDAIVTLVSGALKRMDALEIGDIILSIDRDGVKSYTPFIGWAKAKPERLYSAIRVTTASGAALRAHSNHFVHFARQGEWTTGPIRNVRVGDTVRLASGAIDVVVVVDSVPVVGAYTPMTVSTNIVVDGVAASMWTKTDSPVFHALFAAGSALLGMDEAACRMLAFNIFVKLPYAILPPAAWEWLIAPVSGESVMAHFAVFVTEVFKAPMSLVA